MQHNLDPSNQNIVKWMEGVKRQDKLYGNCKSTPYLTAVASHVPSLNTKMQYKLEDGESDFLFFVLFKYIARMKLVSKVSGSINQLEIVAV